MHQQSWYLGRNGMKVSRIRLSRQSSRDSGETFSKIMSRQMKAISSEAPDLSTVTFLIDPDISRIPTEDVNHSLVPQPQPFKSSKEGGQPSPVSVLEAL
ncbi:hypothetical protein DY000_02037800 [Brassica cretica]|uniref:Uncharacterized protein n=1 Tax=Brassica cretica TaxID=69181 RepID=A0ABQ7BKP1_BRACR|nr:hypothetical protein DY000_02037800 [Brassica cretica]